MSHFPPVRLTVLVESLILWDIWDWSWWVWEASSGSRSTELRDPHTENSTSGWDHSGNDPRLVPVFPRPCSGTVTESVRICGFERNSFNLERPKCGTMSCWIPGQFFSDSVLTLLRSLCDIFLVNSGNGRVPWLAVPRMLLLPFSWNGCQFSLVSQYCHFFERKKAQQ